MNLYHMYCIYTHIYNIMCVYIYIYIVQKRTKTIIKLNELNLTAMDMTLFNRA